MAKQIIRIEQSDSDKLFRDKVNSNFVMVAQEAVSAATTAVAVAAAPGGAFSPPDPPDLTLYCTMELYNELEERVRILEGMLGGGGQFTKDGGIGIWMTNGTGAPTVKGDVVAVDPANNNRFVLCTSGLDAIGVVYSKAKEDGAACLIIVAGRAQVRLEDGGGVAV